MANMFQGCTQLSELYLDIFKTQNVKNMSHMFENCQNLNKMDVTNFNTSKVLDMSAMFKGLLKVFILDLLYIYKNLK